MQERHGTAERVARDGLMRAPAPLDRCYCSYFDSAYLARGLVFLRSLRRFDPSSAILVLAWDETCERIVRLELGADVDVLTVATLQESFPALKEVRRGRSAWASYSTHKPALALFAMRSRPEPAGIVYVDADTWFFADPSSMFDEISAASIALSPHGFHNATQHLEIYGRYNAGCIYWRNDDAGRRCAADWLDDCLEWCEEEPQPDGRFMNQGYLNAWPHRYPDVHILRHAGVNLAPWNIDGRRVEVQGQSVLVDEQPLIFYHFHGLSRLSGGEWVSHFPHLKKHGELSRRAIYEPYLAAVEGEVEKLRRNYGIDGIGSVRSTSDWPIKIRFGRRSGDAGPNAGGAWRRGLLARIGIRRNRLRKSEE